MPGGEDGQGSGREEPAAQEEVEQVELGQGGEEAAGLVSGEPVSGVMASNTNKEGIQQTKNAFLSTFGG